MDFFSLTGNHERKPTNQDNPMKVDVKEIQKTLEEYDFQVKVQERTEEVPIDQLFIYLGEDEQNRPLVLHLRIFKQHFQHEPTDNPETEVSFHELHFLNFFIALPFSVKEESFGELARLVLMINKVCAIPAFGLSEVDKMVYYQCTHLCEEEEMNPDLLLTMIALIMQQIETQLQTFEEVSTGKKTLKSVIEEANKLIQSFEDKEQSQS